MANNAVMFSEVILHLTEDEEQWLMNTMRAAEEIGCRERAVEDSIDISGMSHIQAMEETGYELCEFKFEESENRGRHLWMYSEEHGGDMDRIVTVIQNFLKEFRPKQFFVITWSFTCSKMAAGQFNGGGVVITAHRHSFIDARRWLLKQGQAFLGGSSENAGIN